KRPHAGAVVAWYSGTWGMLTETPPSRCAQPMTGGGRSFALPWAASVHFPPRSRRGGFLPRAAARWAARSYRARARRSFRSARDDRAAGAAEPVPSSVVATMRDLLVGSVPLGEVRGADSQRERGGEGDVLRTPRAAQADARRLGGGLGVGDGAVQLLGVLHGDRRVEAHLHQAGAHGLLAGGLPRVGQVLAVPGADPVPDPGGQFALVLGRGVLALQGACRGGGGPGPEEQRRPLVPPGGGEQLRQDRSESVV